MAHWRNVVEVRISFVFCMCLPAVKEAGLVTCQLSRERARTTLEGELVGLLPLPLYSNTKPDDRNSRGMSSPKTRLSKMRLLETRFGGIAGHFSPSKMLRKSKEEKRSCTEAANILWKRISLILLPQVSVNERGPIKENRENGGKNLSYNNPFSNSTLFQNTQLDNKMPFAN